MTAYYTSLIIDDNPEAVAVLRSALTASHPAYPVTAVGATVSEGVDLVMKHHPSVLFLDVELPDGTGFDLLDMVRERVDWQMRVVFYTAYEKYWLRVLRADGFDFILKPFTDEELAVVTNRLQKELSQSAVIQYPSNREHFRINTLTGSKVYRVSNIGYFIYDPDVRQWQVQLATPDTPAQSLYLRRHTDAAQILLASDRFLQVNKSVIINIDYLCGIEESGI
ncbi:MAG: response regulator, partial [Prevotellaceae bacterium]|nr:response regulator [Prevotellaceae bacterium]